MVRPLLRYPGVLPAAGGTLPAADWLGISVTVHTNGGFLLVNSALCRGVTSDLQNITGSVLTWPDDRPPVVL